MYFSELQNVDNEQVRDNIKRGVYNTTTITWPDGTCTEEKVRYFLVRPGVLIEQQDIEDGTVNPEWAIKAAVKKLVPIYEYICKSAR